MLLLVKCYDNKMVYVTLQLSHLSVDLASGGEPATTKKSISCLSNSDLRLEHINLTLSNTKWGTDLGTLVVLFEQTFHRYIHGQKIYKNICQNIAILIRNLFIILI